MGLLMDAIGDALSKLKEIPLVVNSEVIGG